MKVRATDKFEALKVFPAELGFIPEAGTEFEVSEDRFNALTKNNSFGVAFVEKVEEPKKEEVKKEEVVEDKKPTTKKITSKKPTKKGK